MLRACDKFDTRKSLTTSLAGSSATRNSYSKLLSIRNDTSLVDSKIDDSSDGLTLGTIYMVSWGPFVTKI